MALGRGPRDAEHRGRLLQGTAREETELDDLGFLGMQRFELAQGLIESQELDRIFLREFGQLGEVDSLAVSAAFLGPATTGTVHQDTPHGLGGGGEEMAARVPL